MALLFPDGGYFLLPDGGKLLLPDDVVGKEPPSQTGSTSTGGGASVSWSRSIPGKRDETELHRKFLTYFFNEVLNG